VRVFHFHVEAGLQTGLGRPEGRPLRRGSERRRPPTVDRRPRGAVSDRAAASGRKAHPLAGGIHHLPALPDLQHRARVSRAMLLCAKFDRGSSSGVRSVGRTQTPRRMPSWVVPRKGDRGEGTIADSTARRAGVSTRIPAYQHLVEEGRAGLRGTPQAGTYSDDQLARRSPRIAGLCRRVCRRSG
jgi:hypothetical protein